MSGAGLRAGLIAKKENLSMDESTKDKAKGKFHELKGEIKKKVGKVTNDPDLEAEGESEATDGKVQKKIGEVEKVFGV